MSTAKFIQMTFDKDVVEDGYFLTFKILSFFGLFINFTCLQ